MIKSISEVLECVPDSKTFALTRYNKDDISKETHWKDLKVQENPDFHLSLLSQGKYNRDLVNQYDYNYYYPASAGEGIDIVVLDSIFNFDYPEFSNSNERIKKCAANIMDGKADLSEIDHYCGNDEIYYHGEIVSDMAGGLKHGAAKRANIYDLLGGLQYINEKMIRPHKTIVNLFIVEIHKEGEYYFQQYKNTIDDIINKGGIVVSPSGNSGVELNKFTDQVIPCEFENVICVGGIETYNGAENEGDYIVDENSNYGSSVNFYSAYSIKSEILVNNEIKKLVDHGTSYSSPLVAGLIATLMSENSDIEYTFDTIIKQLNEYGASETFQIFNTVGVLANNGKHIVYSKDDVYYGCEVYAGNLSCSSDSNFFLLI
ncbi:peptidase S8/S53 domain-containing protein [Neocallimastix lanati (nom. inval.)]|nr:peptidase S8/S53 domain-containing protein [Neocallimastix sp. JGI-2020a]